MDNKGPGKLDDLRELISPKRKFREIAAFITQQDTTNVEELKERITSALEEKPILRGIIDIEHEVTLDDEDVFIVVINEEDYPPTLTPGIALLKFKVVFISSSQ